MMTVICSRIPDNLINFAGPTFKNYLDKEWFEDPLVLRMIEDVDKTPRLSGLIFESPVLGLISPLELSGGVKSLICLYKLPMFQNPSVVRSTMFGDNCSRWLAELSYLVDFNIFYCHPLNMYTNGTGDYTFKSTPINAVSEFGDKLPTCGDVVDYYIANFKNEPPFA